MLGNDNIMKITEIEHVLYSSFTHAFYNKSITILNIYKKKIRHLNKYNFLDTYTMYIILDQPNQIYVYVFTCNIYLI